MNILILGMHRSGTSMVSGILEQLGYHIGYEEELIKGGEENPKGFFERRDFRDINDEILINNNFDWYKLADFSIDALTEGSKEKYRSSARKIIDKLDARGKWAIKEPRFCLLYPLLKELTESAIKLVVYREPIESAESLWIRNKFPLYYGLALWEKYHNELFGSLSSDKLLVINYNELLNNPEEEIKTLINGINRISGVEQNTYDIRSAASFVNKKLRRSLQYVEFEQEYLTDSQKKIYDQLSGFEIGHDFEQVSGLLNYTVLKHSQYYSDSAIALEKEKVELSQAEARYKQLNSEYEKILNDIISRDGEIAQIKSTLSWKLTKPLRYLSTKNPRLAKIVGSILRGGFRRLKQKIVLLRTNLKKSDWNPPLDIDKKIIAYKNRKTGGRIKVAVYTAVYGGYDALTTPDQIESDIDYVCYTDRPTDSFGIWQIRAAPYYHPDSTRIARYVKTHPHELLANYDIVVWIDANIIIRGDVWKYINKLKTDKASIGFVRHPIRDCVYDEAEACKDLKKEKHAIIDKQMERYQNKCFPSKAGMYETGFFVANLNDSVINEFFRGWWNEIELYSKRDQLSVGWALYNSKIIKTQLMPNDVTVRNNQDFSIYIHEEAKSFSIPKLLKKHRSVLSPYEAMSYSEVKDQRLKYINNKTIDIVICVYNALEDVKLCLSSVIDHLTDKERIILVNDVSNNETTIYLRQIAEGCDSITLVENKENMGYTRSANRGLQECKADFRIMLNSDTIVSKHWAQKMTDVAFSSDAIGIVGPLSNAAGSQSIPKIKGMRGQTAINQLPKNMKPADMDLYCEKWSSADLFPRVPLIHGFCFGIKKSVIDRIGYFDDVNFERYYGEENDYCFRARAAGFEFAIATNTFVYHRKSRSIEEEERLVHMDKAGKRLREIYGVKNVSLACQQIANHPILVNMRNYASQL